MNCKKCGRWDSELWNGLCSQCNPELAAWLTRRVEEEKKRLSLYFALRSRVLTDEEMQLVERMDIHLVIEPGRAYYEKEMVAEFNAALLQQFKLRLAAERAAK
jgi:predicted DCC family thiol-disulfide oxidoreductase YuxK